MSDDDKVSGGDAGDPIDSTTDSEGTEKAGGLGTDGTIPPDKDGIAAGMGDEDSHFNPEEDPEADSSPGP